MANETTWWNFSRTISDERLKGDLEYYSYNTPLGKTICIHYYDLEWCRKAPYSILCNGGVAMMSFDAEEYGRVCRLCAELQIIIDTKNIH